MTDDSGVLIRSAAGDDLQTLELLLAEFLGITRQELVERGHSIESVLAADENLVALGYVDGRSVGFITASLRRVTRYASPIAEIDELHVSRSSRRGGVGTALVRYVERCAREKGCARVFVASNRTRHEAHRFYSSLGYIDYGTHFRISFELAQSIAVAR